ncbi:NMD3-related protein [Candidatus Altiarchaeota archaeon]
MFCPSCGGKTSEAGLCINCYVKRNKFSLKKDKLEICECGKLSFQNTWSDDWTSFLQKFVEKNLVVPSEIEVHSIDVSGKVVKDNVGLEVDFIGLYRGDQIPQTLEFKLKKNSKTCPSCKNFGRGYFEAVVQYRDDERPSFHYNRELVSRIERVRGGWDFYITNTGYAEQLAGQLQGKGFLIKKTLKLHGEKNGKKIYRTYHSIKKPLFEVGDILEFKDNPYVVERLGEKTIIKRLENGKEKEVPVNRLIDTVILAKKDGIIKAVVTEVKPRETNAMNLEDYANFRLNGRTNEIKQGEEIKAIKVKGKWYVL